MIVDLLFYLFSFCAIVASLMVVSLKNPVHSVLFLIFAFFNAAGLFLLLGAELLAMLLVIVYVGAVAILFLFVVMMLNVDREEKKNPALRYLPAGLLLATVMVVEFVLVIGSSVGDLMQNKGSDAQTFVETLTNVEQIGRVLYTDYIYLFQLAGLVLLVAMIGAIVLTNRVRKDRRRQSVPVQLARDPKASVSLTKVAVGQGVAAVEKKS